MPYGVATETFKLSTTLLCLCESILPRYLKILTKSCLVPAKNLAPYLPCNYQKNLPRTCPGPGLKKLENSWICLGPLKILPWTRHPPDPADPPVYYTDIMQGSKVNRHFPKCKQFYRHAVLPKTHHHEEASSKRENLKRATVSNPG